MQSKTCEIWKIHQSKKPKTATEQSTFQLEITKAIENINNKTFKVYLRRKCDEELLYIQFRILREGNLYP